MLPLVLIEIAITLTQSGAEPPAPPCKPAAQVAQLAQVDAPACTITPPVAKPGAPRAASAPPP